MHIYIFPTTSLGGGSFSLGGSILFWRYSYLIWMVVSSWGVYSFLEVLLSYMDGCFVLGGVFSSLTGCS